MLSTAIASVPLFLTTTIRVADIQLLRKRKVTVPLPTRLNRRNICWRAWEFHRFHILWQEFDFCLFKLVYNSLVRQILMPVHFGLFEESFINSFLSNLVTGPVMAGGSTVRDTT